MISKSRDPSGSEQNLIHRQRQPSTCIFLRAGQECHRCHRHSPSSWQTTLRPLPVYISSESQVFNVWCFISSSMEVHRSLCGYFGYLLHSLRLITIGNAKWQVSDRPRQSSLQKDQCIFPAAPTYGWCMLCAQLPERLLLQPVSARLAPVTGNDSRIFRRTVGWIQQAHAEVVSCSDRCPDGRSRRSWPPTPICPGLGLSQLAIVDSRGWCFVSEQKASGPRSQGRSLLCCKRLSSQPFWPDFLHPRRCVVSRVVAPELWECRCRHDTCPTTKLLLPTMTWYSLESASSSLTFFPLHGAPRLRSQAQFIPWRWQDADIVTVSVEPVFPAFPSWKPRRLPDDLDLVWSHPARPDLRASVGFSRRWQSQERKTLVWYEDPRLSGISKSCRALARGPPVFPASYASDRPPLAARGYPFRCPRIRTLYQFPCAVAPFDPFPTWAHFARIPWLCSFCDSLHSCALQFTDHSYGLACVLRWRLAQTAFGLAFVHNMCRTLVWHCHRAHACSTVVAESG